jgi:hypothetical protein
LVCIEIQTPGPFSVKFGKGICLNGRKVNSWVSTPTPLGSGGRAPLQPQPFDLLKTL